MRVVARRTFLRFRYCSIHVKVHVFLTYSAVKRRVSMGSRNLVPAVSPMSGSPTFDTKKKQNRNGETKQNKKVAILEKKRNFLMALERLGIKQTLMYNNIYYLYLTMSYPKIFAENILVFFLVKINCQILWFYSNPILPSKIVLGDIFRGFFPLPGRIACKTCNTQTNSQTSSKHGKYTKKPTKFHTAKT